MKVSIVLPCFKSEAYVADMINDIIRQSYTDWELIVVSNGPGQEAQNGVIQGFADVDPRIHLIKTDIPGVSHARNLGMKEAKGDWLTFVDADDRLMVDHLQIFVDTALKPENKDVDVIVSGYWRKNINEKNPHPSPLVPFRGIDYANISKHYSAIYVPFNKFLSLSTLQKWGGTFDENITCAEDGIFAFRLLNYTQNIVAIDITGYIYNENPGSAMGRFHSDYHTALEILKDQMVKLFAKSLNKEELSQFIHNRNYYNASWEIHNLMQKDSPFGFVKAVREVHKIITDPQLRASLPLLKLETNSPVEKIKIGLMKCRASLLLALIYKLK